MKKALKSIGVDTAPFGSHSCRRGGVTAAVAHGVEIRLIAKHWRSNAIFAYVTDSLDRRLTVSQATQS